MLLVLPLKTTKRTDLTKPLSLWIDSTHPHFTSDQCRDDLIRLSSLRNCISDAIVTPHGHATAMAERALSDLHEYHNCLLICERAGFPKKDDATTAVIGGGGLKLAWKCAFGSDNADGLTVRSNMRHERACVLWDIAALDSYRAAKEDLTTKEGRARAMKGFQASASTLEYLMYQVMNGMNHKGGEVVDFSVIDNDPPIELTDETLLLCRDLMLAQAQLCAYEAAVARSPPVHGLLSKIASGAADLYDTTLSHAKDGVIKARIPKTSRGWAAHAKAMSMLFKTRAELHQSMEERSTQQYGMEITRLIKVEKMCRHAKTFHSDAEDALREIGATTATSMPGTVYSAVGVSAKDNNRASLLSVEIDSIKRKVVQRREEAEKDNRTIYRETIPREDDLVKVQGQSLVSKTLPLSEDLDPYSLSRPFMATLPSV